MRVAMVDDTSLYTNKLLEGLRENGTDCIHYAPTLPPRGKLRQIMGPMGPTSAKVWSSTFFPFQILKRALRDRPGVVHLQFEFYGIHSYGPLYASLEVPLLLFLLRVFGFKVVVTLHAILPRGDALKIIRDTSPSSKRLPTPLLEAFLLLSYGAISWISSVLVVHADVFRNRLIQDYRVKEEKIKVIPHGVDFIPTASSDTRRVSDEEQNTILYFGVISPRKGLESLISAFAILASKTDKCRLLLVGASPPYYRDYELKLKNFASEFGFGPRLQFLGVVEGKLAHSLFSEAKFIVLPYAYDLSASGALSWALSHGLPVVASETQYFKEELSRSKFGLSFPTGNPDSLSSAMEALIEHEDLRLSLAKTAKSMGESRSWSSVAKATLRVYQDLLPRNANLRVPSFDKPTSQARIERLQGGENNRAPVCWSTLTPACSRHSND